MRTNLHEGIFIRTRTGGKLFNLVRLLASSKIKETCVRERLFANQSALVAYSMEDMQHIVDQYSCAVNMFGLNSNTSKTELKYPTDGHNIASITIWRAAKIYQTFTYLNSAVICILTSKVKGNTVCHKGFWLTPARNTKTEVYSDAVFSCILNTVECMHVFLRQAQEVLDKVYFRHLLSLLHIR